jgi:hypothetical protein
VQEDGTEGCDGTKSLSEEQEQLTNFTIRESLAGSYKGSKILEDGLTFE